MQFDDDEIYFQCPNCPATYGFKEFFELEHMAQASPADGPDVLGHAKCRNCSKEFYYYLSSDAYPILVEDESPLEALLGAFAQLDAANVPPIPDQPALEQEGKAQEDLKGDELDKMALFEQTLEGIDKELQPLELTKKISAALDTILTESPPNIEAAFDLLAKRFGLKVRKIEAFRKEVNRKRDQIETDKKIQDINAIFAKLSRPPKEMEEKEKAKALAYLRNPNLFQNISKDIAVAGEIVGEETNKMMLYLAATSRKFKRPISLVIFGKSSSGKSYLANAIEEFMPEEDTLVLSSVTAKALEYADDQLKNKCLLVQEWEGLKEALPTLRVLQSEAKLSRYVTIIDPKTKTRKAVPHDQECPCSVIVTTTKEGIHDENSTRIFELYADESVEQTQKVVRATIDKADMTMSMSPEAKKEILELHRNAQRLLEPMEVNVPYARYISFPAKTTRHRRDSGRFVNLIKAVAFLRQKQKGQIKTLNGERCIDAELADYKIAYEIGWNVLRATLNSISDRAKNALIVCCNLNDRYLEAKKDPWFSVTEIQETAGKIGLDFRNRPDLYKQLESLEEYEYLERQQARKNAMRHYKVRFAYQRNEAGEIINIDLPDIKEILTPEQLEEKIKEGRRDTAVGTEQQTEGKEGDIYFAELEGSNSVVEESD
jgi:hypothetical protein